LLEARRESRASDSGAEVLEGRRWPVHGFIFSELSKYVQARLGNGQWDALLNAAGIGPKRYQNFMVYDDAEAVRLVMTASELTGNSPAAILEDFGRFLGADLVKIYRPLLNPAWKTLDFLENVEETIHNVVRTRNAAKPPVLLFERTAIDSILLTYRSQRKLDALAVGIAHGIADYYEERLFATYLSTVSEPSYESKIAFTLIRDEEPGD
jgi:hypothetical protein